MQQRLKEQTQAQKALPVRWAGGIGTISWDGHGWQGGLASHGAPGDARTGRAADRSSAHRAGQVSHRANRLHLAEEMVDTAGVRRQETERRCEIRAAPKWHEPLLSTARWTKEPRQRERANTVQHPIAESEKNYRWGDR